MANLDQQGCFRKAIISSLNLEADLVSTAIMENIAKALIQHLWQD